MSEQFRGESHRRPGNFGGTGRLIAQKIAERREVQNVLVWKRYEPKKQGAIIALTTGRYLHKWGGICCPLAKSCVSGKDITPQGGGRPGPWSRYYQVRVLRAKLSFQEADASLWLQVNPPVRARARCSMCRDRIEIW